MASAVPRSVRLGAFAALALVVGGVAIALVVSRLQGPAATDTTAISVRASMGGFDPSALIVKPGETVRIELTSLDTAFHSDGGGWHQFAIDELGVDWKVGPQTSEVFELIAPTAPGTYSWYCDICCGGKENPSMRGTLTVAA
ncbi:MAG: cupredoxin domain-containing protein [Candidatus Limnocylindria bacterium]